MGADEMSREMTQSRKEPIAPFISKKSDEGSRRNPRRIIHTETMAGKGGTRSE
jgi:hypothetical protein